MNSKANKKQKKTQKRHEFKIKIRMSYMDLLQKKKNKKATAETTATTATTTTMRTWSTYNLKHHQRNRATERKGPQKRKMRESKRKRLKNNYRL